MAVLRQVPIVLVALLLLFGGASPVAAESPAVVRELTCSDGTRFMGKQVRMGATPHSWVNATAGATPSAFIIHALKIYSLTGVVVQELTLGSFENVSRNHEIVTCGFIINGGPFNGLPIVFYGYFVP